MKRKLWRPRIIIVLLTVALAVLGLLLTANWLNRRLWNYSRIEDGLYVGGHILKPPRDATAVLNLCEKEDPYLVEVHRWEPIADGEPTPSLDWLRHQVEFVQEQRKAGRTVYVHCHAGISRSGMVVVAYLMAREGWSLDEALTFVRARRSIVCPNPAFLGLLKDWEKSLKRDRGWLTDRKIAGDHEDRQIPAEAEGKNS
jgi:hypothetical protein